MASHWGVTGADMEVTTGVVKVGGDVAIGGADMGVNAGAETGERADTGVDAGESVGADVGVDAGVCTDPFLD